MTNEAKHEMTVREAGKKGGEAVKRKYGSEYYSKIGRKGGSTSGQTADEAKPSQGTIPTTASDR